MGFLFMPYLSTIVNGELSWNLIIKPNHKHYDFSQLFRLAIDAWLGQDRRLGIMHATAAAIFMRVMMESIVRVLARVFVQFLLLNFFCRSDQVHHY